MGIKIKYRKGDKFMAELVEIDGDEYIVKFGGKRIRMKKESLDVMECVPVYFSTEKIERANEMRRMYREGYSDGLETALDAVSSIRKGV